jgi:hypothetical protein
MKKSLSDTREVGKWMKRVATVSAVLFIISLAGFIAANTLPAEVEQETPLLSYEHRGRFNYLVYLKPSYLFGPEPEEPPLPPPNPKYPTEIIDSIDMSFTYETDSETLQGVGVKAILENPGLWQKEIELVPITDEAGSFTVEFELDLEEINELFDTIDEETLIKSSARMVTIVATVGLGFGLQSESLIQSLPMKLEKNILEVDYDLIETQLDSSGEVEALGEFDYTIHLKENSLFDTETLKPPPVTPYTPPPPTTIGVGTIIPYQLVDIMDTSYYYSFRPEYPVEEVTEEITITATLENPELWSRTFILVPPTTESGDFRVSFPIDVNHLNELLGAISDETEIPAETYNLIIQADVHTMAETEFGPIDDVFSQTLSSSLGEGTLVWNEELVASESGAITKTKVIPNPNKYLGLSVDRLRILCAILGGIFLIFFVISFVLYNKFKPAEPSLTEKEALQAGKKYGQRMAEATSQIPMEGEKIVSMGSMEDLIKVADELGKPVVHQPPSASEKRHAYYVFDGATRYQYILSPRGKERRNNAGKTG